MERVRCSYGHRFMVERWELDMADDPDLLCSECYTKRVEQALLPTTMAKGAMFYAMKEAGLVK